MSNNNLSNGKDHVPNGKDYVQDSVKNEKELDDYIDVDEILKDEEIKSKPSFNVSENSKKLEDLLNDMQDEIKQMNQKLSKMTVNSEEIQKIKEDLSSLNEDFEIFQRILKEAINFKKQEEKENELIENNPYEKNFKRNLSEESEYESSDENDLSFTQKEELRRSESKDSGLEK